MKQIRITIFLNDTVILNYIFFSASMKMKKMLLNYVFLLLFS